MRSGVGIADALKALDTAQLDARAVAELENEAKTAEETLASCATNSFPSDTQVLMADGSHKAISGVKAGDYVLATSTNGGVRAEPVTAAFSHPTRRLIDIALKGGGNVSTTAWHSFYVPERGWTFAVDLHSGDSPRAADGSTHQVAGLTDRGDLESQSVYDLTVDDLHTFYVLAGSTPVLVHNASGVCRITSVIHDDSLLVKAAEAAGKNQVVQRDLDNMIARLADGNLNQGIGSSYLTGTDVSYLRSSNGARLFFRNVDGGIQIVAKSSKANEDKVIARLLQLYAK